MVYAVSTITIAGWQKRKKGDERALLLLPSEDFLALTYEI
jgi:hypothetical protein